MKSWYIAFKDTLIRFRDRNGVLLMIAAPLVLAAVMGAAFGGFGGGAAGSAPLRDIPVIVVNDDAGDRGNQVVSALKSGELADLLEVQETADLTAARALAARGEVRAVIHVPRDFSRALDPTGPAAPAQLRVYTDPTSSFGPLIVRAVVAEIASSFNAAAAGSRIAAELAPATGSGDVLRSLPAALQASIEANTGDGSRVQIEVAARSQSGGGRVSPLAYFAPSMAVLSLMFTLFDAARSLLEEEREGTLARLVSSPTRFGSVLLGKIGGVFLTGVMQLAVLVFASALIFRLRWGSSPAGLALMVLAVVAAASSLGALIVAVSRDERQAAIAGSAIALIFAILGGNFVEGGSYPAWMQPLTRLTINRWALDGFTDLTLRGKGLLDVLPEAGVLFGAAVLFFALAWWRLPRRFVR